MTFFALLFTQEFLRHALLGALLASIACGMVGPFVVVRKIGSVAGGISHAVLGGMGIAYFFHLNPLFGAVVSALLVALLLGMISLRIKHYEDVMINAFWAIGMALGILFLSKTPGYNTDLMSYLFGNVLMIPQGFLILMGILVAFIMLFISLFYKELVAISFDAEFATVRGISTTFYYLFLLIMVALTVVLLIQVVGLILVIALITLPAAMSRYFAHSIGKMMVISSLFGSFFSFLGLALSFLANLPTGSTIVLVAALCFMLVFPWKKEMQISE